MTVDERAGEARGAGREAYGTAPAADAGVDVRGLVAFWRRRRGLILGCALLGALAGGIAGYARPPSYAASALVLIEPKRDSLLDVGALASGLPPDATFVETQIRLATSRSFIEKAVDHLALVPADPDRLRQIALDAAAPSIAARGWLERLLPSNWLLATGIARDRPLMSSEAMREEIRRARIEEVEESLDVRQQGRSLILAITYTARDPQIAARRANAIAELFVAEQLDERVAALKGANEWLQTRIGELGEELRATENAIEEYRAQNELLQAQSITPETEQAAVLTNMLVKARAERREKEARIRYIRDLMRQGQSLNALSEVLQSPYMQSLWEQERALAMQEAELLNTYGEKHPLIARLRSEKAKLRQQQEQEIGRIVDNIRNEIAVIEAREQSIQADIADLMAKTSESARAAIRLRELEREAEANRKLYEDFLRQQKEIEAKLKLTMPSARVVARADTPDAPSSPPPVLFGFIGFLGAGFAGLGLAWLRERLDQGIRSGREIEALFGLPCFALVPQLGKRELKKHRLPHLYLCAKPLSTYAEAMRAIHTALRTVDIDRPPKVVHVTSSVPGEGKTTTVASLAASLARDGKRVVAVDLDLRHPALLRAVGGRPAHGLVDVLLGEAELDDALVRDRQTGVDWLPVRRAADNPGALLSSRRLRELLDELRQRYDYVVIDSTPALGVSDAKRVAELADATIFLVRWEQTAADTVEDALEDLAKHRIRPAAAVLTQVDIVRLARYGYGGIDQYYSKYRKYYVD